MPVIVVGRIAVTFFGCLKTFVVFDIGLITMYCCAVLLTVSGLVAISCIFGCAEAFVGDLITLLKSFWDVLEGFGCSVPFLLFCNACVATALECDKRSVMFGFDEIFCGVTVVWTLL